VTEFIESEDPIQLLGSLNRLHFREENNKDDVLKIVDSLPETTEEVKLCTQDLKVLGRKEFKMLLRWRLKARRVMGLSVKKAPLTADASSKATTAVGAADDALAEGAEGVTVESMDDELRLQQEIKQMKEMADKTKRKERRKENERKQKEITRLQMHMITPTDIGIEAADNGDNTFKLRDVDKSGIARELSRARMHTTVEPDKHHETEFDEEDEEDEDGDRLEAELDQMYQQYTEKREDRSAKVKAKRARMKARGGSDDEFEGFGSDNNDEGSDSDDGLRMEDDDDASSDEEEDENGDKLMTDLQSKPAPRKDGLTNRAANFFEQDIFKDIGGVDDDVEEDDEDEVDPDSGVDVNSASPEPNEVAKAKVAKATKKAAPFAKDDEDSDDEIEYVDTAPDEQMEWEDEEDAAAARGKPNIDIITAEAMTLAHQLATGKITKQQLLDDNFNKISLRDVDGLPEWFLDDENQHSKTQRPITKEAAAAIKEKTKALNARPIKKVREAKARKTMRAARRVEKLKKKSEGLAEGDDLSEKDKATNIAKIMSKAKKGVNKKPQPKLVVAGGFNKGKGRPRGIKGKYKMVDARMKKETRALKRIAKKKK
jgi:AdoMet-dependent rRNA methyltransferase SPB1